MADQPQLPKQEPKKSIFGKEEASPNIISDISGQVNNMSRALKLLEDKYSTIRNKSQVTEQNMLTNDRKIMSDIKLINSEMMDLKSDINDIKEKMTLLVQELKLTATKEEVGVIGKYLGYWEPLNFVTRDELNKILSEKRGKL